MRYVVLLWLFFFANVISKAQEKQCILEVEKVSFDSQYLEEERVVFISLPEHFDSSLTYPVLYVLDAETHLETALAITRNLIYQGTIPAHIIVGVNHIDEMHRYKDLTFGVTEYDAWGEKDTTNFWTEEITGGGQNFLNFLTKEVVVHVDENYKTNGFNVLVGHSLSGLFCAEIMPKPDVFKAYQIHDASIWYNRMGVISYLKQHLPKDFRSNTFFGSARGRFLVEYHLKAIDSLNNMFSEYPGIRSLSKEYIGEEHLSMFLPGLFDGLKFLYDGYDFGFVAPEDKVTADDVTKWYQDFSEKVNFQFTPPLGYYRWVGFANYTQGKWEEAVKALLLSYPEFKSDEHVNSELYDCYTKLGNDQEAQRYKL